MHVARNKHSFKLADVERLFHKAKEMIAQEKKFWELDGVMEDEISPFVITINE